MGVVWQATDTKLGREVAIKILPAAFVRESDSLARFQREAQVLASLNHKYIASIYGFEEAGDVHALVMELVEGPTPRLGDPRLLFTGSFQPDADAGSSWAIHPDAKRFLMVLQDEKPRQASRLVVVENWFAEIEELVGQ